MGRYRIIIEYDGGPFVGWQRQDNGPSIQGSIEAAIKAFSSESVTVTGAGRTDAGVHAFGQVAHFDLEKDFHPDRVRDAINHFLRPAPIAILSAEVAAPDFHARFSATTRHYLYRIVCRKAPLVMDRGHAWQVTHTLDADAMHEAAQYLVGCHDFTTFRASECQAQSPVKTLDKIVVRKALDEIAVETSARSFLHHQVRSMVGTLKLVGEGKWLPRDVDAALKACDRRRCGTVAPPDGLYFVKVDY